tara:strand:- start:145 stop:519 length:375 start_codon:yes stop_codon:yes gene_type:complete
MEVYASYLVGSSITAFLGKVAYSYLYPEPECTTEEVKNVEYSLVDTNLNERQVKSDKDNKHLGNTFKEKMVNLQKILRIECRREHVINNTRKVRAKWIRYIKEYETIGHSEFVFSHTSRPFKSN